MTMFLKLLVIIFLFEKTFANESLEDVVKQILKISPPEHRVKDEHPPKHMLELYHKFISGKRASGETVRSIAPFTGMIRINWNIDVSENVICIFIFNKV